MLRRITYIGIYPPTAPRDKTYLSALVQNGATLETFVSSTRGLRKYYELFKKLFRGEKGGLVWVGYLSGIAVISAFLAGRRPIVYNALASSYESYVLDRALYKRFSLRAFWCWTTDFLAFHLATAVLLESEAQCQYVARQYFVSRKKLHVVYTGADESVFHPDESIKKERVFTVVFRGIFAPATGVEYVLESANILRNEPIHFIIIGWGQLKDNVVRYIAQNDLKNVELITVFQEPDELRRKILSAHVMLGQFSDNPRLDRTIQHKTFEALALGMPYITRDSKSNRELLKDGENCLFVPPADAESISRAILTLYADTQLRAQLSVCARKTYTDKLTPRILREHIVHIIENITDYTIPN